MPPIGDSLREARMRQELDIADVEERTKIRAKYLRALENEEFGVLPGPATVRAFLRTYAEMLGLDAHVLLEEYRVTHEPPDENDAQPLAETAPPPRRMPSGPPIGPPGRGMVVAGLLVALLALLLILGLSGQDESKDKPTTTTQDQTRERRKPQRRARKPPPPPKGITLNVAPVDPTYVCVDRGVGTPVVFEGILAEPRTFKAPGKLRLNLGKTSAALKVNGRAVQVERTADPVGFEFSGNASKPLESGRRPCA
jgi:cytoskeleton protein RodZ